MDEGKGGCQCAIFIGKRYLNATKIALFGMWSHYALCKSYGEKNNQTFSSVNLSLDALISLCLCHSVCLSRSFSLSNTMAALASNPIPSFIAIF